MAKLWIGLTVAAVIIGARLVALHPSMPDTLEGREDFLARGINKAAPLAMGPYLTMTGAKVGDGSLEIDVGQSPTAPRVTVDGNFKHGLALTTCKDPTFSDLINRGGSIRYAITTSDGAALPPATVSPADCPTA